MKTWVRLSKLNGDDIEEVYLLDDVNVENIVIGNKIVSFNPVFRSSPIEGLHKHEFFAIINTKNSQYKAELMTYNEMAEQVLPWPNTD